MVADVADGRTGPHAGPVKPLQTYVASPIAPCTNVDNDADKIRLGYAPEQIQYGIDRYGNETRRLYRTMDDHLAKSPHGFLVGDRVTIADISCWGWVSSHSTSCSPLCQAGSYIPLKCVS